MEIGKEYFIAVRNGRIATGVVLNLYDDNQVAERVIETTTDIKEAQLFESHSNAIELAERYSMKVKKVRADILGLGSRWND